MTQKTIMSPKWEKIYAEELRQKTDLDGSLNAPIRYLDIRFSNFCNFACRTCDSASSSRWEELDRQLGRQAHPLRDWDLGPEVKEEFFKTLREVEEIYFAGGEPLIHPEHYRTLEFLVANRGGEVTLTYNTNLSSTRYKTHDVLDYWPKFKAVRLIPSLDGIGKQGEYIRSGLQWNRFQENLERVRPFVSSLHAVVSIYNVLCVLDLIRWAKREHNLKTNLFCCYSPDFLSITMLSPDLKKNITKRYREFIEDFMPFLDEDEISELQQILRYMNSTDRQDLSTRFKRFNEKLDLCHGSSFGETFPELRDWYSQIPS